MCALPSARESFHPNHSDSTKRLILLPGFSSEESTEEIIDLIWIRKHNKSVDSQGNKKLLTGIEKHSIHKMTAIIASLMGFILPN